MYNSINSSSSGYETSAENAEIIEELLRRRKRTSTQTPTAPPPKVGAGQAIKKFLTPRPSSPSPSAGRGEKLIEMLAGARPIPETRLEKRLQQVGQRYEQGQPLLSKPLQQRIPQPIQRVAQVGLQMSYDQAQAVGMTAEQQTQQYNELANMGYSPEQIIQMMAQMGAQPQQSSDRPQRQPVRIRQQPGSPYYGKHYLCNPPGREPEINIFRDSQHMNRKINIFKQGRNPRSINGTQVPRPHMAEWHIATPRGIRKGGRPPMVY